ncbi:MAG: hypothetical protein M4579_000107 [Chaenotheca gracillima]|nr:MAG: hypothetical protein M4579_000107 [Chaenotheca gracillima]
MSERPSTPPPRASAPSAGQGTPLTPEQTRRIELNRLKAKAIRDQREAESRNAEGTATLRRASSGGTAGQKRPYAAMATSKTPSTVRDGRSNTAASSGGFTKPRDDIQPAQKFNKFVEYDFSKMTDTKGGFLTAEDDPHNKAFHAPTDEEKPAHMTLAEWERHRLLKSLRDKRAGPFEPGLSVLKQEESKQCVECSSLEIDWKWDEIFGCRICNLCKERLPERYSLLTKTEAKEDYLLTDPELKDEELLPHLERPNPHKSTWNNMMLYLRYQVEEYAFSAKKWGSSEALDEEFTKREAEKKKRKEEKFRSKLQDLKKRTRVEAYRRNRTNGGAGRGEFGDDLGMGGKHQHEWGRTVENAETGVGVKQCIECGMEVEELEF